MPIKTQAVSEVTPAGPGEGAASGSAGSDPGKLRPARTVPQGAGETQRSRWSALGAIWPLLRPRRAHLLGAVLLMVVNRSAGLVLPVSTKFLVEDVIGKKQAATLSFVLGAVLLATVVQALSAYLVTQSLSKTSSRLIAELRMRLQACMARLPIAYHDNHHTGSLVSRVMNDPEGIRNLIGNGMIEFAGGLLTAAFALVLLLYISVEITLLAMAFLIVFGIVQRKLLGILLPTARERGRIMAELTGRLTESLAGIRVVKAYRAESREEAVFRSYIHRLLANVLRTTDRAALATMCSTSLIGIVAAVIMFVGAQQILSGHLTLANYLTFTVLLAYLVSPVSQSVAAGTQLADAVAGLQRCWEVLQEYQEDDDPRRTVAVDKRSLAGHLVFDKVSFSYVQGKRVIHQVSFDCAPGTVTALVGSSGSGKSTIVGMTCAFHNPESGRILIDGIDLATVELSGYRGLLGVVLQESFLFDGTIRENIAFAKPDAAPAEIREAARIARVDEFAGRFPEGLDTMIGERGVKLSGGQRQRVSIARAILADPRILILDEATSSLDSESEAAIQAGLKYLIKGRTTLVIAHRLSTIHAADQILVVEDGRVVERGRHGELLRRRGRYYDLYTRQHSVETNLFLAPGEGDGTKL
ncbi:MAG: ABC transporter ATP-binding protein [Acidobacteriia bacterium]|nr:ABC transporter ATP-binding protein [Terriglobia bacterium]